MKELQRKGPELQDSEAETADSGSVESIGGKRLPLSRQDWINAARDLLIQGGIEHVRIGRLAESLNVTRGGFYWLFSSRDDLLDELLEDWIKTNTLPFEKLLNTEGKGTEELQALFDMWLEEKEYSPPYDSAVRDWARLSEATAAAVKEVDFRRIDLMKNIFLDLGYPEDEAFVRARIAYFHQVGYYMLRLEDSREARIKSRPLYVKVLSGLDIS